MRKFLDNEIVGIYGRPDMYGTVVGYDTDTRSYRVDNVKRLSIDFDDNIGTITKISVEFNLGSYNIAGRALIKLSELNPYFPKKEIPTITKAYTENVGISLNNKLVALKDPKIIGKVRHITWSPGTDLYAVFPNGGLIYTGNAQDAKTLKIAHPYEVNCRFPIMRLNELVLPNEEVVNLVEDWNRNVRQFMIGGTVL